jgi:hypothetical protein
MSTSWLHDPPQLLAWLRAQDLRFGTGAALRATALLDYLAMAGRAPTDPKEVARWLSPVLCISADERERLRQALSHYAEAWLDEPVPLVPPLPALPPAPTAADRREAATLGQMARRALWLWPGVAVIAGLLLVLWLFWYGAGSSAPAALPTEPSNVILAPMWERLRAWLPDFDGMRFAILPWVAWLLFRHYYRRRPPVLRRRQAVEGPQQRVPVAAIQSSLFLEPRLRQALQAMRRHRLIEVEEIDISRSLGATVAAGGRPCFVRAERPLRPDYPVLVEQLSGSDHLTELGRALVDRLQDEQVAATLYTFEADPRGVRRSDGRWARLEDLTYRHGPDALIMVSDGEPLLDHLTSRVRSWVRELSGRPFAILLTPVPMHRWSWRERRLAEAGLVVLPATRQGLETLASYVEREAEPPQPALSREPSRPSLVMSQGRSELTWHQDWPVPDASQREELLEALAADLPKPAFDLLCAIALFPEVRLDLTLHLGRSLKRRDGSDLLDEASFGAVAWLPWLRFGRIPDWLRRELVLCLTPQQLDAARCAFQNWLVTSEDTPAGAEVFELTDETRQLLPRWLRREAARDPASPYRDLIFLRFMDNKPLDELDLEAPEALARELRPRWLDPERLALYVAAPLSLLCLVVPGPLSALRDGFVSAPVAAWLQLSASVLLILVWHARELGWRLPGKGSGVLDPPLLAALHAALFALSTVTDWAGWPWVTATLALGFLVPARVPFKSTLRPQRVGWFLVMLAVCAVLMVPRTEDVPLFAPSFLDRSLLFLGLAVLAILSTVEYPLDRFHDCVALSLCLLISILIALAMTVEELQKASILSSPTLLSLLTMLALVAVTHAALVGAWLTGRLVSLGAACALTGLAFGVTVLAHLMEAWGFESLTGSEQPSRSLLAVMLLPVLPTYLVLSGVLLWQYEKLTQLLTYMRAVLFGIVALLVGSGVYALDLVPSLSLGPWTPIVAGIVLQLLLVPGAVSLILTQPSSPRGLLAAALRPYMSSAIVLALPLAVPLWLLGLQFSIARITFALPLLYLPLAAWLAARRGPDGLELLVLSMLPLLFGMSLGPVATAHNPGLALATVLLFWMVSDQQFRTETLLADTIRRRDLVFLFVVLGMSITWQVGLFTLGGSLVVTLYFALFLLGASQVARRLIIAAILIAGGIGVIVDFVQPPPPIAGLSVTYAWGDVGQIGTALVCCTAGGLWFHRTFWAVRTSAQSSWRALATPGPIAIVTALALLPHLEFSLGSTARDSLVTATALQPAFFLLGFIAGPGTVLVALTGITLGELLPGVLLTGSVFLSGGPALALGPVQVSLQFPSLLQTLANRVDDLGMLLLGWRIGMAIVLSRGAEEQSALRQAA